MKDPKNKGIVIQMSDSAARKLEFDESFDADQMLKEVKARIEQLRKEKPASFELKRLVQNTGTSDHLRKMFENGRKSERQRKATQK